MAPVPLEACHPYPGSEDQIDPHGWAALGPLRYAMPGLIAGGAIIGLEILFFTLMCLWNHRKRKATKEDRKARGCTCFDKWDYFLLPSRYWANNMYCHCGAYRNENSTPVTQTQATALASRSVAPMATSAAYNPASAGSPISTGNTATATNANNTSTADSASKAENAQQQVAMQSSPPMQEKPADTKTMETKPAQQQETVVTQPA